MKHAPRASIRRDDANLANPTHVDSALRHGSTPGNCNGIVGPTTIVGFRWCRRASRSLLRGRRPRDILPANYHLRQDGLCWPITIDGYLQPKLPNGKSTGKGERVLKKVMTGARPSRHPLERGSDTVAACSSVRLGSSIPTHSVRYQTPEKNRASIVECNGRACPGSW